MTEMLSALADPILPIFAVMGFGVLFARAGLFEADAARALNRFVFYIAQPALFVFLAATAPIETYRLEIMGAYLLGEILHYAVATWIFARLFGFGLRDAILLGMTAIFINHFYFSLPIAEILAGDPAAEPIAATAFVDAAVLFCGTVFIMELIGSERRSLSAVPRMLLRNPSLLGLAAGLAINLTGDWAPSGILTLTEFAGKAAAPVILFALGVMLAKTRLFERDPVMLTSLGLKLVAAPLIALAMVSAAGAPASWTGPLVFVAAGPSGAMPFVLALHYNATQPIIDVVSKTILASTILSLLTLAALAPILPG